MPQQNQNKPQQSSNSGPDFIPYNPPVSAQQPDFIPYNPPAPAKDPNTGYLSGLSESFPSSFKDYATQVAAGPLAPRIPSTDEASSMFQKEGWGGLVHAIPGYDAASDLVKNFPERFERGWKNAPAQFGGKILGGAAEALSPLVGINPENVEARADKGDTAGIYGELTVPTAMAGATALEGPLKGPIRSMLSPYREATGMRLVGEGIGAPTSPSALQMKGMDLPKEIKAGQDLNLVKPDIAEVSRRFPTKGSGSEATFYNAKNLHDYNSQLWDEAHRQVVQDPRNVGLPVDANSLVRAGMNAITPEALKAEALAKNTTPQEIQQRLSTSLQGTVGAVGSLGELDGLIREINQDVNTPRAQQTYGPLDMRVRQAVLKAARGEVDNVLMSHNEPGVKDANRRWGAMDNVIDKMVDKGVAEAKAEGKEGLIPDWAHMYMFEHVGGVPSVGVGIRPSQALRQSSSAKISSGMKKLGKSTLKAPPFVGPRAPSAPGPAGMALPGTPGQPPAPPAGQPLPGTTAPPQPPPPQSPVGGPPTMGFPAQLPNQMWTGTTGPVQPTWEAPGTSVPSNAPGVQPTSVELPDTILATGRGDLQPGLRGLPDAQINRIPSFLRENIGTRPTPAPGSYSEGGRAEVMTPGGGPSHPPSDQGGASVPSTSTPPPTDLSVIPHGQPEATVLPEQIRPDFVDESVHPWQSDERVAKKQVDIQSGNPATIVARPNPDGTVSPVKGHQSPVAASREGAPVQVVNAGPITDGEKAAMTAESHFFPQDDRAVPADLGKDAENERDALPEEVKAAPALPAKEGPEVQKIQRGNALPERIGQERRVSDLPSVTMKPGEDINQALARTARENLSTLESRRQSAKTPQERSQLENQIRGMQQGRRKTDVTTPENLNFKLNEILKTTQQFLNDPRATPEMKQRALQSIQTLRQALGKI